MNTFLKACMAAGLAITAPSAAYAQDDDIVVTSQRSMEEWAQNTTRNLNRKLQVGSEHRNLGSVRGIVQVRFQQDERGRPVNIELYRSSGDVHVDRTAQWAVRRLKNLDEVPVRNARDATFQANIIFADSAADKADLERELQSIERSRLARGSAERGVISLGS